MHRTQDGYPNQSDGLVLRIDLHDALVDGQPVGLTPREFEVLAALVDMPHEVVPTDALLRALWGSSDNADPHAIEVYVSRIRRKLRGPNLTNALLDACNLLTMTTHGSGFTVFDV